MVKKFIASLFLAGLVHAESTITEAAGTVPTVYSPATLSNNVQPSSVISFWIDDADPQELAGSVITANPTMTAYFFQCVDPDECGFGNGGNLTVSNQNTYIVTLSEGDAIQVQASCVAYNTESVVCSDSLGGSEANTQSGQPSADTNQAILMPLTITAGLDKLASASATVTDSSSSETSTGSKTSGIAKKTSSGTSTATGSVPSSNAGRVQTWSIIGLLSVAVMMLSL